MELQHTLDPITNYVTQILAEYQVIPANFGWHIHQEDTYFGLLQYHETTGWEGEAFTHLPLEIQQNLKKFGQPNSPLLEVAA